jgi:nitrogen-specific signal transduction histidine kinase
VGRGTGQGLALAKAVVAQHGGHLGFETAPGHGTTFTIRLPLAAPAAAPTEAHPASAGPNTYTRDDIRVVAS